MQFNLRISLPDRPGTLGAVAGALGEGGANILTLEVVDREDGFAVDDLCVEAPQGMQEALRKASEWVPGLVVEEVRPLQAFRDFLAPMELAAVLAESAPGEAVGRLVGHLPDALRASWALAMRSGPGGPELLGSSVGAPSSAGIKTPWLPLEGPRRLAPARWMPHRWRMGLAARMSEGRLEVAAAPLLDAHSAVLIGRRTGPRFRRNELRQLGLLSRIAASSAGSRADASQEEIQNSAGVAGGS